MVKVLFVCLGNICRSPMAEAIFRHKISQRGLDGDFLVDSCGTSNYHIGDSPDPRTITATTKNGVKIDHCVRQLRTEDLDEFDFIVAMDRSNLLNIQRLMTRKAHRANIFLMRDHDSKARGEEVPDPYYGNANHFQEVFEILDRSTEDFLTHLEEHVLRNR